MVAKERHVTRAANKLFISQPSLSAVIMRLEKELGVPLVNHIGRNIELNKYGQLLFSFSNHVLGEYDLLIKNINTYQKKEENTLHLGLSGPNFATSLIKNFINKYPTINIEQSIVSLNSINTGIIEKDFDFIIVASPKIPEDYNVQLLWKEKLYIAVPPNHPLAEEKGSYLEYFSHEKFISLPKEHAFRQFINNLCQKSGFTPNIVIECFPGQILSFVHSGYGVAIVPESAAFTKESSFKNNLILIMNENYIRPIYLIWPKTEQLRVSAKLFLDFATEYSKIHSSIK